VTLEFLERSRAARVPVPRRASLDALLRFAWDAEVFTAGDALAVTGLSRSTTIEAIDDLVALGLVRELANARAGGEYRKGRPSRRFELRADAAVVVGVDAGQGHLVTTVADLRGRTLATRRELVGASDDSAAGRRVLLVDAIDAALAEAGVGRADVLSVCVGVPAPVDSVGVSPVHRDGFWSRMNPDFLGLLSSWAPLVRIENDAVLASVAEHTRGAAVGLRNTVTVLAGERLGAGVVIDGTLLRGAHGGVGEVVVIRHLRGVDAAYGIGHHLEAWAAEEVSSGTLPADHPLRTAAPDAVSARAVVDLARAGDPVGRGLVERAGATLARIAGVFGSLYDPERIVVSGGLAAGVEELLVVARRLLPDELDLPAPELVASSLGADVVSTGAVAAALESARDGALHVG
jgi:predicted NBD/HSP70 family sugar kinase